jgi:hypothetical protein
LHATLIPSLLVSQEESVMDNRSLFRTLAVAALAVAVAAAIGIGAYNAGVAQGLASGSVAGAAPPAAQGPLPYPYGYPYAYGWHRPWGGPFFPFFPVFPILFFVVAILVIRGLVWRGGWRGPWRGWDAYGPHGVPSAFEEWHRRAHGGTSQGASAAGGPRE